MYTLWSFLVQTGALCYKWILYCAFWYQLVLSSTNEYTLVVSDTIWYILIPSFYFYYFLVLSTKNGYFGYKFKSLDTFLSLLVASPCCFCLDDHWHGQWSSHLLSLVYWIIDRVQVSLPNVSSLISFQTCNWNTIELARSLHCWLFDCSTQSVIKWESTVKLCTTCEPKAASYEWSMTRVKKAEGLVSMMAVSRIETSAPVFSLLC